MQMAGTYFLNLNIKFNEARTVPAPHCHMDPVDDAPRDMAC